MTPQPPQRNKRVKAFAVIFIGDEPDVLSVFSNKILVNPMAIFEKKEQAIKWRNSVHEGGVIARNAATKIIEVEVTYKI